MTSIQPPQHPCDLRADAAVGVVQNGERASATRYHGVSNMTEELRSVKYQVPAVAGHGEDVDEVEQIRRRFAAAWGQMGAAWGVPPSTAMVQGYMLVHGGPVTDKELQDALGLSHRAIRLALEDCEEWGIVRRAAEPRRSGRRGPAEPGWPSTITGSGSAASSRHERCARVIRSSPSWSSASWRRATPRKARNLRTCECFYSCLDSLRIRSRTLGRRTCPHRSVAQAVQGAVGAGRQGARSTAQLAGRYSGRRAGFGRRHDLEDAFRLGAPAMRLAGRPTVARLLGGR